MGVQEMFNPTILRGIQNVAGSYRIQRDAEFGPLVHPSRRPGMRRLMELANYHSALLGTVLPLLTDAECEKVFEHCNRGEWQLLEDPADQEALTELLGNLASNRRTRDAR